LRFPCRPIGSDDAYHAPILTVGVRASGVVVGTDLAVMVDTGADQSLLHYRWARLMGYGDADLTEHQSKSANGLMTVYRPRGRRRVEFQIGDLWLSVPSFQFAKKVPISLLGRDMMFEHFEHVTVSATHFEFSPKKSLI
jgi:aspartyl protease